MRNLKPLYEAMQAPQLLKKYQSALEAKIIQEVPADQKLGDLSDISEFVAEAFADLCAADPTSNVTADGQVQRVGTYAPWLIERYLSGELDLSHLSMASVLLQAFDAHRSTLADVQQRNIQTYKTMTDFYQVAHPLVAIRDQRARDKMSKTAARKEEYVVEIPVNEGWKCWCPLTAAKAKQMGNSFDAQWCTAGSDEWKSRFEEYVIDNHSALFILSGPEEGDVYQTHIQTMRNGQPYDAMHGPENDALEVDERAEVRQRSGFTLELQQEYTEKLADKIQDLWQEGVGQGETEGDNGAWRNLVMLAAFHPQHPSIRAGENLWLSVDSKSKGMLRNFVRLPVEQQNQALDKIQVRFNIIGSDKMAKLIKDVQLTVDMDLGRDDDQSLNYILHGLENGFDVEDNYSGTGDWEQQARDNIYQAIMSAKNRDEALALMVACVNNSKGLRNFLGASPLGFHEEGVKQLFTAFNSDLVSSRDVLKFAQNTWDEDEEFTTALGRWCSEINRNEHEGGVYLWAEDVVYDILNLHLAGKVSQNSGEREYQLSVYSTPVSKSAIAMQHYSTAALQDSGTKLVTFSDEFFISENGDGMDNSYESLLDDDINFDMDRADNFITYTSINDSLHHAIHELDFIFDDSSGSPTLHEIWHAIEQSGEDMEAKIKKAVELVDFGASTDVGDDGEDEDEAED